MTELLRAPFHFLVHTVFCLHYYLGFFTTLFPQSERWQSVCVIPLLYNILQFFFFFALKVHHLYWGLTKASSIFVYSLYSFSLCRGHAGHLSVTSAYWACSSGGAFAHAVCSEGIHFPPALCKAACCWGFRAGLKSHLRGLVWYAETASLFHDSFP